MYVPKTHAEFIARLEQEVRDLKTAQKASSLIKGYFFEVQVSDIGRFRIDYEDGDEPILTESLTYGTAMSTPSNNSQYIWFYGAAYYLPVYFISNRKITAFTFDPE